MKRTRRDFAKLAATALAAAPLIASDAVAQTTPAAAAPAPPPESSDALRYSEAQTSILRARYGKHLTPDDARTIEKDLDDTAGYMKLMHSIELTNADEPDTIFFTEGGPR
ncbi:MAG: hypothetical protein WC538_06210 [Thermoanaerobaculia bacterium]|jgi:hypothetical protein